MLEIRGKKQKDLGIMIEEFRNFSILTRNSSLRVLGFRWEYQSQSLVAGYHTELRFHDNIYVYKDLHALQEALAVRTEVFQVQAFTDIEIAFGKGFDSLKPWLVTHLGVFKVYDYIVRVFMRIKRIQELSYRPEEQWARQPVDV